MCGSGVVYSGGSRVTSSDSGSTWSVDTIYDMMFEEWGEIAKFLILKDITTVTTGDIKVGAYSSFQTGYGFANAYTYWHQPWKEWRGGFTDQNDHDATLSFSGAINCLVILGANFSEIEIDSVSHSLGSNPIYNDRRVLVLMEPTTSPLAFTIPAETTSEGYFKMVSVILGNATALGRNPSYHKPKQVQQPVREVVLESQHPRMAKQGRRNRILEYNRKGLSCSEAEWLRTIKRSVGLADPFVLYENVGDAGQTFLVRRLADFQYQESGYKNHEDVLRLEEIA
jgi:hypothetical protein